MHTLISCMPFSLPTRGIISIDATSSVTITGSAVFMPECTGSFITDHTPSKHDKNPFYASVTPQTYVIGATTMIAWMLVTILFITPRKFSPLTTSRGARFWSVRNLIDRASRRTSFSGVGSRPLLQKIAALTVGISLTIATADTFKVAERQYRESYINAIALREEVTGSLQIKIVRVISNLFLWLAQVQTLTRLFPRHKEKVMIKWTGFSLIVLDTIFSFLNAFLTSSIGRPRRFVDSISALHYLFSLALSLLYAAWVIYYALTKRRYAFYHYTMRNICLVALLSVVAILTPVVFFAIDISNPGIAGWGDYFRWVGAAAASVVVWEWVERIEAIEREDRKDGILGREIFDGDEMLDVTPSEEVDSPRHHRKRPPRDDDHGGYAPSAHGKRRSGIARRLGRLRHGTEQIESHIPLGTVHSPLTEKRMEILGDTATNNDTSDSALLTTPAAAVSTLSRTRSADISTLYSVRQYEISNDQPTPGTDGYLNRPLPGPIQTSGDSGAGQLSGTSTEGGSATTEAGSNPSRRTKDEEHGTETEDTSLRKDKVEASGTGAEQDRPGNPVLDRDRSTRPINKTRLRWQAFTDPFKRNRNLPPQEVRSASVIGQVERSSESQSQGSQPRSSWLPRFGSATEETRERPSEKPKKRPVDADLPIITIPAQPRGPVWSPRTLNDT